MNALTVQVIDADPGVRHRAGEGERCIVDFASIGLRDTGTAIDSE